MRCVFNPRSRARCSKCYVWGLTWLWRSREESRAVRWNHFPAHTKSTIWSRRQNHLVISYPTVLSSYNREKVSYDPVRKRRENKPLWSLYFASSLQTNGKWWKEGNGMVKYCLPKWKSIVFKWSSLRSQESPTHEDSVICAIETGRSKSTHHWTWDTLRYVDAGSDQGAWHSCVTPSQSLPGCSTPGCFLTYRNPNAVSGQWQRDKDFKSLSFVPGAAFSP